MTTFTEVGINYPLVDAKVTVVTENFYTTFEDRITTFLSRMGCRNVTPGRVPPIMTWGDLVTGLAIYDLQEPSQAYEAWFAERTRIIHDPVTLGTREKYYQQHSIEIEGLTWHNDFNISYKYVQDKAEEILIGASRDLDLAMGSQAELILSQSASFPWSNFGEVYLYRARINMEVLSIVTETGGRVVS